MTEITRNPDLPNLYRIILGDPSGDGHGKTVDVSFYTNLLDYEIEQAFEDAKKKTKVDLRLVCAEFDDYYLEKQVFDKLDKFGIFDCEEFEKYEDLDFEENDGKVSLDVDSFVFIVFSFIKIGNPDFKYQAYEIPLVTDLCGLGYGLFY